ncbi:hypothetical protein HDU67_004763, partial [Dinochytrium kinnereticum]
MSSLTIGILSEMLAQIRNPFKQVREALGAVIDDAIHSRWFVGATTVEDVLRLNMQESYDAISKSIIPKQFDAEIVGLLRGVFDNLRVWREKEQPKIAIGVSGDYANASKTLLSAFCTSMIKPGNRMTFAYLEFIYPELFHMIAYDDSDLQKISSVVASMYPTQLHPPTFVSVAAERLLATLQDDTGKFPWHVKAKVLPILQVFYFRHLHLMPEDVAVRVVEVVALLMEDRQIEVRQLAGTTLSGLIRCSQREAADALKARFYATLKKTKAAKKRATLPPRAMSSPNLTDQVIGSPSTAA